MPIVDTVEQKKSLASRFLEAKKFSFRTGAVGHRHSIVTSESKSSEQFILCVVIESNIIAFPINLAISLFKED